MKESFKSNHEYERSPDEEDFSGLYKENPTAIYERTTPTETGLMLAEQEKTLEKGDIDSPEEVEAKRLQTESEQAKAETTRVEAVGLALKEVHETLDSQDIESLIEGIDFSNDKFTFETHNSLHGEAKAFHEAGRFEGNGKLMKPNYPEKDKPVPENEWGNPAKEAHSSHQVVEQVGIRSTVDHKYEKQEKRVPRRGLAGKLGFKQKIMEDVQVGEETKYVFDYAFAAPSHGEDAAKKAGNYTAQQIHLSVELTKEQATQLSSILAENPKAARQVLDGFVRATGDYGKWNAELYDDEGNFHDPAERYGKELEARDVRPNYDAVPDVEPQIVGLIGVNKEATPKPEMYLPAA